MREGAHDRALIGEGDGKVGRNEKESGGGSEEGGVNEGREEINGNRKVEQDVKNEGSANRKILHAVQKGSAEGKVGKISRKIPRN